MSNQVDMDRCVFVADLMTVILANLKQGQTCTRVVSAKGKFELEVAFVKLGDKRLPKTRRPS